MKDRNNLLYRLNGHFVDPFVLSGLVANRPNRRNVLRAVAMDIYREDNGTIVVKADLPGGSIERMDVGVERNILTISGTLPKTTLSEGEKPLVIERPTGEFCRQVELPFEADTDNVEASYNNGVLTVRVRKSAAPEKRKIAIKGTEAEGEGTQAH